MPEEVPPDESHHVQGTHLPAVHQDVGGAEGLLQEHLPLVHIAATLLCPHHTDVSHCLMRQGKEKVIQGRRKILCSVEGERRT